MNGLKGLKGGAGEFWEREKKRNFKRTGGLGGKWQNIERPKNLLSAPKGKKNVQKKSSQKYSLQRQKSATDEKKTQRATRNEKK